MIRTLTDRGAAYVVSLVRSRDARRDRYVLDATGTVDHHGTTARDAMGDETTGGPNITAATSGVLHSSPTPAQWDARRQSERSGTTLPIGLHSSHGVTVVTDRVPTSAQVSRDSSARHRPGSTHTVPVDPVTGAPIDGRAFLHAVTYGRLADDGTRDYSDGVTVLPWQQSTDARVRTVFAVDRDGTTERVALPMPDGVTYRAPDYAVSEATRERRERERRALLGLAPRTPGRVPSCHCGTCAKCRDRDRKRAARARARAIRDRNERLARQHDATLAAERADRAERERAIATGLAEGAPDRMTPDH